MATPRDGIDWQPWGPDAFAQARAAGKPVLLHIGATWCHWCHVMDEGTYVDARVRRLLAERFVAVRVDTDQRPDVNDRYNQGGWPTVAVLDADGEVLVGRLYAPAHELVALLESCTQPGQRWIIGKGDAPDLLDARAEPPAVWAAVKKAYDPWHGGFGELEKFPHPGVLDWIADRVARGEDDGGMLVRTLDAMWSRGLGDPVAGGFFRYATQDDWGAVHYEKLAEDQARLLRLYLRTGRCPDAVEHGLRWVVRWLWRDDVRAFAGSMDADQGHYAAEVRGAPPPVDPTVVAAWNAQLACTLLRAAAKLARPGLAGLAQAALGHVRDQLVDADGRVRRSAESDAVGLLEDQAAVADAFAQLGAWTGDDAWFALAGRTLAAAEGLRLAEGGYRDAPAGPGLLAHARRPLPPNAALGEAAWRLHALTEAPRWREMAEEAARGAEAEADRYGFMAAPAAALRERLSARTVTVKVAANPELLAQAWALDDPDLVVRRVAGGVPAGAALACSGQACARPATTLDELRRQVAGLRRG